MHKDTTKQQTPKFVFKCFVSRKSSTSIGKYNSEVKLLRSNQAISSNTTIKLSDAKKQSITASSQTYRKFYSNDKSSYFNSHKRIIPATFNVNDNFPARYSTRVTLYKLPTKRPQTAQNYKYDQVPHQILENKINFMLSFYSPKRNEKDKIKKVVKAFSHRLSTKELTSPFYNKVDNKVKEYVTYKGEILFAKKLGT